MTGVIASTVVNLMGAKTRPADFAPFYREPGPRPRGNASLRDAFAFLRANAKTHVPKPK